LPISGKILSVPKKAENQYDLFEFFVEANKGLSRATILQRLGRPADFDPHGAVSDADLLAELLRGARRCHAQFGKEISLTPP
jgi:hypothetical protein